MREEGVRRVPRARFDLCPDADLLQDLRVDNLVRLEESFPRICFQFLQAGHDRLCIEVREANVSGQFIPRNWYGNWCIVACTRGIGSNRGRSFIIAQVIDENLSVPRRLRYFCREA